jgi:hypothetical protein
VPQGLADFLARALAKDPNERFQTGEEFAAALRMAAAGEAEMKPAAAATVDFEL